MVLLALTILAGCAGGPPNGGQGVEQVKVTQTDGQITLTSSGPGHADVNTHFTPDGAPAVHFSTFEDAAQGIADLYVYGLAPSGTKTVQTDPPGAATLNSDLTFVVVILDGANAPTQSVHWTFLNNAGSVLAEGNGPND